MKVCIACFLALMAGCKQNSSPIAPPVQTSLLTYQPKGTISGLIKNFVTAAPVAGAIISVGSEGGVLSATSNGAGAFSFANVPAGQYQIVDGTVVFTGTYIMTVSLLDYNTKQTDAAKKYRDYYYVPVTIKFTSLAPGDSLAVSGLVGATHLDISYLNTTVTGQVVGQNQQPVANATVMLYDATVFPNVLLAQTTSSASGGYQFTAVDNGLTVTIKAQSSDGSLQGTLAGFTLSANVASDTQVKMEPVMISPLYTTVAGLVVDQNQQPVANATVMIYDVTVFPNALLAQTTSSASGGYQFSAVANGLTITIKARSSDGSLEGTLAGFTLPANVTNDSLRSQVNAERIMMTPVDNVNPFIVGLTPENNSDVSLANLQVVYTFSEPIKKTAYTRTDLPPGHNTIIDDISVTYVGFKKTAAAITFSAQWNTDFTQLTLTPQGIIGSAKYSVNALAAFNSGKLTDNANRVVTNNTLITGDFELLQFTTSGGSTLPGAPTLSRRFVSGLFGGLDFNGGTVGLEWTPDGNARSYNTYRSVNGGSFDLLQSNVFALQVTDNISSLVIPIGATDPLKAGNVRYLVRGESMDLVEGPSSNIIQVGDGISPRLLASTSVASAGATNSWIYTLRFSEPLTIASAENIGNYAFVGTGVVTFTVNTASYIGNNAGVYIVQLGVTTSAALPVGYTLVVSSLTDLANNGLDATAKSKTF
jgi:hypothetical protein